MAVYKNRRDELENQLNKGALWAVTYGDLMSYLMIFFLVLFSFSIAKTDKVKSRKYEESLVNIQRAFGGKADDKRVERGKAELKDRAREVLKPILEELKKLPNDVLVEGHTDNVPIHKGRYATNWELSMARAYSVVKFIEENGVSSKKLAGSGYGDNRPVAENTTVAGRAKNRRIEISLIKSE